MQRAGQTGRSEAVVYTALCQGRVRLSFLVCESLWGVDELFYVGVSVYTRELLFVYAVCGLDGSRAEL